MDITPLLLAIAIIAIAALSFTLAHYIWEAKFYKQTSEYWHIEAQTGWDAYRGARDECDAIKDRILNEQACKTNFGPTR